jgi:6-phosphogluconate dehydrogenase
VQLAMVGLGRMGGNIVRRLIRAGHSCVGFDADQAAVVRLTTEGAIGATSIADMVGKLDVPRTVWMMLPHGAITTNAIDTLTLLLSSGDTIIDGGNSFHQDDVERSANLKARGIRYLDVGTSGGVAGLERGYCMMIG